jgi:hypothetical protein
MSLCTRLLVLSFALLLARYVDGQGNGVPVNPVSPTSSVPGHVFDRYVVIWLENTVEITLSARRRQPLTLKTGL